MHIRELLNYVANNMKRKSYENLENKATEIVKDATTPRTKTTTTNTATS